MTVRSNAVNTTTARYAPGPEQIKPVFTLLFALLVAAIYGLNLHAGQDWSGDFSQYIHHAKNLVEGKNYLDTGFIVSSLAIFVGPYAYPPVFPLLLTPVYWLYGLDLEAMKPVGIACLCVALLVMPRLFAYQLNRWQQFTIIVLVAANPFFWEYRNYILSDYCFIVMAYLALYLMLQLFNSRDKQQGTASARTLLLSGLIGFVSYLTYGSREIGIIMPLCVIAYEIVSTRKITWISIVSTATFGIFFYLQHRLLDGDLTPVDIQQNLARIIEKDAIPSADSHLDFISIDPQAILARIQGYRWALQEFLPFNGNQSIEILDSLLFNLATLMALCGYIMALFKKITVLEIFFAGYVAVLLLFGAPPTARYLMPLFPLTLYYVLVAYQYLLPSNPYRIKTLFAVVLLGAIAISYGYAFATQPYDKLTKGVSHPDAVAMFDFVRNHTAADDTMVFLKPRTLSLFTGRTSVGYRRTAAPTPEQTDEFFDAVKGDYYIDISLDIWIYPLINSAPPSASFHEVFRNPHFAIYHYQPKREG